MASVWPLCGRDRELERIDALLRGDGGGLLFVGPAGVGKSRLVQESIARAGEGRRPWNVVHLRAAGSGAAMPLGVFTPLLAEDELDASSEVRAVAVTRHLRAHGDRVVLAVDDLHMLDDASAGLLLTLVASGAVVLVGSLRHDERAPETVHALWKDELVGRVDVGPLSDQAVGALIDVELAAPVHGPTRHTLIARSSGNPLYLREMLRGCVESGALTNEHGVWRLGERFTPSIRLSELIEERIGVLSPIEREVLDLVVVGEPCELTWLDPERTTDAVAELERRQIVQLAQAEGRVVVHPGHPLFAEVVKASHSVLDHRRICRVLVERAERSASASPAVARRSLLWRLDAGLDSDPGAVVAAAHQARAADQLPLALRLAREATRLADTVEIRLLLAELLELGGEYREAEEVLAGARPGTEEERVRVGLLRADVLFRGLQQFDAAQALSESLAQQVASDDLRAELLAQQAGYRVYRNDMGAALELAERLGQTTNRRAFCQSATPIAMALSSAGKYEEAARLALRAAGVRAELEDEPQLVPASIHRLLHLMASAEGGEITRATHDGRAAYDEAVAHGHTEATAWLGGGLATVLLHAGRIDDAERFAREAMIYFDEAGNPAVLWASAALALAVCYRGDADGAADILSDCDAQQVAVVPFFADLVDRARAWQAAAGGDLIRARALLAEQAERLGAAHKHGYEANVLFDIARLGDPTSVLARLREITPEITGRLPALRLSAVEALAVRNAYELDEVAGELAAIGAMLLAAETANEAAVAFQADGEPRRAAAARRRAEEYAAHCPGAATPALAHGTEAARLTRREREIATLAAAGTSSRDIAEQLGVSHRTVETHLQNAYDKLGVRSRSELGALLEQGRLSS